MTSGMNLNRGVIFFGGEAVSAFEKSDELEGTRTFAAVLVKEPVDPTVEPLHDIRQRVADLYEAARSGVYRSLIAAGFDSERAREATQEAFLRLYVSLRDGAEIENRRAWVYRVAHNIALDSLARQSRESGMPDALAETAASRHESAEQGMIQRQWIENVRRAIAQLSPQQRTCLELRAQGMKYQDIAEVLQIRPSTVGEFLRRAIRQLRKTNLCSQ